MMRPEQLNISVLVSVGSHPKTGRSRRADQDARAVEMALQLEQSQLQVLHAGQADEPALRQYLGMGLACLDVLALPEGADVVPALVRELKQSGADLVLTGVQAESGESSGLTPYLLAEQLGWAFVPRVAAIESCSSGKLKVLQALPRGQRRAVQVTLPCVLSIDSAAPTPRQSAFGPAQRGQIQVLVPDSATPVVQQDWQVQPARKRPKRLKMVKAKTAAERFKAATAKAASEGGQVLVPKTAEEGAAAILKLLREEGVLR